MADTRTLRVGVLAPVSTLDPRETQDLTSALVVTQIYETPYAEPKAAGAPTEPLLLQERLRLEPSAGGAAVYSAAVRQDVRFSDGTPMTARHVADSLSKSATLREQADVEAKGDRLVFQLKRPNARFDMVLARHFCGVTLDSGGRLLGTGPYMAAPGASLERMRLVRNPHHRKPAALDEVQLQHYPLDAEGRPSALIAALESGEVDFTNTLSREDITHLKNVRRWTEPGSSTAILYMNTERPGLDDPRVRRAIALSINRLEVAKMFYSSALAFAAAGLLPPMLARAADGLNSDLGQARALLAQPGLRRPDRLRLLLIYGPRPYLPNPHRVGEHLAARLGELGMQVELAPTSSPQDWFARVKRGDYDLALSGWIADTLDPVDFLEATLGSDSIPSPTRKSTVGANLSRWRSQEIDDALAHLRENPRDDLRAELLRRIADEVPLFPLLYGATIYAHAWKLKNLVPSPLGKPYFADLDF